MILVVPAVSMIYIPQMLRSFIHHFTTAGLCHKEVVVVVVVVVVGLLPRKIHSRASLARCSSSSLFLGGGAEGGV